MLTKFEVLDHLRATMGQPVTVEQADAMRTWIGNLVASLMIGDHYTECGAIEFADEDDEGWQTPCEDECTCGLARDNDLLQSIAKALLPHLSTPKVPHE